MREKPGPGQELPKTVFQEPAQAACRKVDPVFCENAATTNRVRASCRFREAAYRSGFRGHPSSEHRGQVIIGGTQVLSSSISRNAGVNGRL
jgi:hypothetical protein